MLWQAGKSVHHAYQSGLLEHVLSCTKLGIVLSAHYKTNLSCVVAGCILHDVCKIYELTEGPMVDYTEEGKLIGHLVKVLEVVDHYALRIKNFPYSQKTHLKHILLSHHGEYEYGSPKIPHTSEAFLVHLIDMMDSKMSAIDQVKKNDNSTGHWSGMIKHLDRVIYKNELPSFKNYVDDSSQNSNEISEAKNEKKHTATATSKDLKQTLGSKLKDFKVE
jgi:3'-5' exoribonuclease